VQVQVQIQKQKQKQKQKQNGPGSFPLLGAKFKVQGFINFINKSTLL
jgi:hypothetical protein